MGNLAITPAEWAALLYLTVVALLEAGSLETMAYAGVDSSMIRALWLSPYILTLILPSFGVAAWLGWVSDSASSDIKLVFRILGPVAVALFALICFLRD